MTGPIMFYDKYILFTTTPYFETGVFLFVLDVDMSTISLDNPIVIDLA